MKYYIPVIATKNGSTIYTSFELNRDMPITNIAVINEIATELQDQCKYDSLSILYWRRFEDAE